MTDTQEQRIKTYIEVRNELYAPENRSEEPFNVNPRHAVNATGGIHELLARANDPREKQSVAIKVAEAAWGEPADSTTAQQLLFRGLKEPDPQTQTIYRVAAGIIGGIYRERF